MYITLVAAYRCLASFESRQSTPLSPFWNLTTRGKPTAYPPPIPRFILAPTRLWTRFAAMSYSPQGEQPDSGHAPFTSPASTMTDGPNHSTGAGFNRRRVSISGPTGISSTWYIVLDTLDAMAASASLDSIECLARAARRENPSPCLETEKRCLHHSVDLRYREALGSLERW